VILTPSPTLHAAQSRGFDQTPATTTRKLGELAATLARGRTRRDRQAKPCRPRSTGSPGPRWVTRVLRILKLSRAPRRRTHRRNAAQRAFLRSPVRWGLPV
jgi:hypothetical protein